MFTGGAPPAKVWIVEAGPTCPDEQNETTKARTAVETAAGARLDANELATSRVYYLFTPNGGRGTGSWNGLAEWWSGARA
jgi:hypothetical protein